MEGVLLSTIFHTHKIPETMHSRILRKTLENQEEFFMKNRGAKLGVPRLFFIKKSAYDFQCFLNRCANAWFRESNNLCTPFFIFFTFLFYRSYTKRIISIKSHI
ncbi:MAG: hypothetical protein A3J54_01355 [Candidatus Ryanbacteria bacterium RIFCSPHIGHO2_02_FULL_45_13b]|uniref:Uncharacterized protein n=1 Tax=Candidatus Ryanbacteria bacterium RIFCSPHIGHO2_02_FULL_45_13b TaxID=1802117 RepID=A0A1G2GAF2_9BACT|nr:MAG: hypothetical protein A3J54_01355 [Candidatus Ryanbacteria bacterium RIFCSPHIGHO2_02_FULL_45_13b]